MSDGRPWYREPESFIALTALVVSVSAVVVGIYEASLQRAHDRAEVWPRVDVSTYVSPKTASVTVANTGLGPAIIQSVIVTVDGKPYRNWDEVLEVLLGTSPKRRDERTVAERALRGGDETTVLSVPMEEWPPGFWDYIGRVDVRICYASVFGDRWMLDRHLGARGAWQSVSRCPEQTAGTDF
ncbi:MAG TPA: hypothetical protein VHV78_05290 [Gemmatimonadaceae bacterium]|nr:hypothetical protein [Gemmatimonadaceae bacterium]